ncbi:MAG: N-acetyltransferase [Sphingobacteriales bacterium]|nr:MAG: N-acetyltransferase [Sphingobacteriales bacterium]
MEQTYLVVDNSEKQQFQVELPDDIALLQYRWKENMLALMHTEVPEKYEGQGIASALAKHAFSYAANTGKKVLPYCAYIAMYLKRHPEYDNLVEPV